MLHKVSSTMPSTPEVQPDGERTLKVTDSDVLLPEEPSSTVTKEPATTSPAIDASTANPPLQIDITKPVESNDLQSLSPVPDEEPANIEADEYEYAHHKYVADCLTETNPRHLQDRLKWVHSLWLRAIDSCIDAGFGDAGLDGDRCAYWQTAQKFAEQVFKELKHTHSHHHHLQHSIHRNIQQHEATKVVEMEIMFVVEFISFAWAKYNTLRMNCLPAYGSQLVQIWDSRGCTPRRHLLLAIKVMIEKLEARLKSIPLTQTDMWDLWQGQYDALKRKNSELSGEGGRELDIGVVVKHP